MLATCLIPIGLMYVTLVPLSQLETIYSEIALFQTFEIGPKEHVALHVKCTGDHVPGFLISAVTSAGQ